MTGNRCTLALALCLALTADAAAQFVPIVGLPGIGQGGIRFSVGGRRVNVSGFVPLGPPYAAVLPVTPTPLGFRQVAPAYLPYGYGYPPFAPGFPFPGYGAIEQRITVQIVNPPAVLVQGRRVGLREESYDLSGIDLDVESPDKIWGPRPAIAKANPPRPAEPVRVPAPANPPPPPNAEPAPDGQRFVDLGVAAFKAGEYGVANLRFRQAAQSDPPHPRGLFLQAQACVAVGKYREAVQMIEAGLRERPDWLLNRFRPRIELYADRDDVWKEHRIAIENAWKQAPANADYPFLLGYLDWFDGERDAAINHFKLTKALTPDPRWCNLFLNAAAKK